MPRLALTALTTGIFLTTSSGIAIAPFLLDMASDLRTDLTRVGSLVAFSAITWGLASVLAGAISDRLGRRPVLLAGLLVLGASRLLLGLTPSYLGAVAAQVIGGVGGGTFTSTAFATVSDHAPVARRGRALGALLNGQSLSFVFGVPLVTLTASWLGWRGAIIAQGLALLAVTGPVAAGVPSRRPAADPDSVSHFGALRVLDRRLLALLGAGATERWCFVVLAVYLASFLVIAYQVSFTVLAVALALVALGNLAGNILGGRLADRVASRPRVFALTSAVTGLLALPLMGWQPGLALSIVLGFAYTLTNALGRPALMAALSEVPADVRGSILGLNTTTASLGWLGASAVGGWLIARHGFWALGAVSALAGLAGAALGIAAARRARPGG